jgi:hypothetical protein
MEYDIRLSTRKMGKYKHGKNISENKDNQAHVYEENLSKRNADSNSKARSVSNLSHVRSGS